MSEPGRFLLCFSGCKSLGKVPTDDMLRTFNMGIGLIVVCASEQVRPRTRSARSRWRNAALADRSAFARGRRRGPLRGLNMSRAIGVLISGRGSNLQALIDAMKSGALPARIAVVISNKPEAPGLERARAAGIETLVVDHRKFASRDAFDAALARELKSRGVVLVCLAGFMRLIGTPLLEAFPNAILNVHPSLLPAFPGVSAQAQAIVHGVKVSGATVHLVTGELDGGPIVLQHAVEVRDDDTEQTLADADSRSGAPALSGGRARRALGNWRLEGRRFVLP